MFTHTFNKPLTAGYFPSSWAEGHVVPLHKKGDINNVNNYRGIKLLKSKKISNDQELIQSDPISCPQNQKGNN